jgi:muramoyltetrapeptide carboxypeptidase LdcA involved in peptidoglycan recycling
MKYPEFLKQGDTIGICALSCGIVEEDDIKRLDEAKDNLINMGYKVLETAHVRTQEGGASTDAKTRVDEFMELYRNPEVKLIILAAGGDYQFETLDYLDFDELNSLPPKWVEGYSDCTNSTFILTSILDIASVYCQSIKDFSMKPLFRNLEDALKIVSGENMLVQESFDMHEPIGFNLDDPERALENKYNLTEKVEWKNLRGEESLSFSGRALGGCLDCIEPLFGTKYDKIGEFIEKYKDDGIVWFFDCFSYSTPRLEVVLWKMNHLGYFKNCKGIIFGRPLFVTEEYDITFRDAVYNRFKNSNIPVILDADIGHVSPQLAMITGSIIEVESKDGKGKVKTLLK